MSDKILTEENLEEIHRKKQEKREKKKEQIREKMKEMGIDEGLIENSITMAEKNPQLWDYFCTIPTMNKAQLNMTKIMIKQKLKSNNLNQFIKK